MAPGIIIKLKLKIKSIRVSINLVCRVDRVYRMDQ